MPLFLSPKKRRKERETDRKRERGEEGRRAINRCPALFSFFGGGARADNALDIYQRFITTALKT